MTRTEGTTPNTRPSPAKTEAEIQDTKRIEKMQAHCSSHRTAGSAETPIGDAKRRK